MDVPTEVFRFDRTTELHRTRTRSIHAVLTGDAAPPDQPATGEHGLDYAVAHHFLEGAELAARDRDRDLLRWYRTNLAAPPDHWFFRTSLGRRIVASPQPARASATPRQRPPVGARDGGNVALRGVGGVRVQRPPVEGVP